MDTSAKIQELLDAVDKEWVGEFNKRATEMFPDVEVKESPTSGNGVVMISPPLVIKKDGGHYMMTDEQREKYDAMRSAVRKEIVKKHGKLAVGILSCDHSDCEEGGSPGRKE